MQHEPYDKYVRRTLREAEPYNRHWQEERTPLRVKVTVVGMIVLICGALWSLAAFGG